MSKSESTMPVRVIEETSAYWRVLFDYPPFNIMDATIFEGLQDLLARIACSNGLEPRPARRGVRERESRVLSCPL